MEDQNTCDRARKWLLSLQTIDVFNSGETLKSLDSSAISNIYAGFVIRGLRIDQMQSGRVVCTFKVPPRLLDEEGRWRAGLIMSMVDNVCGAAIMTCDKPLKVFVDYNLSYFSVVEDHDEIEIDARVLGHKGGLSTVVVDLRNKVEEN
ncbi:hypothetical protein KI387_012046 [Taxus chinensis]|uniref:Thioesterase domain-containing protein n=1 Tax=Taxus chinensis TaxID=29808 RepID=A0AA38CKC3_TAXCH|nr:hypothetical protein KI387_012046 [Taxus chinensis]